MRYNKKKGFQQTLIKKSAKSIIIRLTCASVSYTHLDVYKRQDIKFGENLVNEKQIVIEDVTLQISIAKQ